MFTRTSAPPYSTATASSGGGCQFSYLLPPVAVVGIGVLIMFISLGSTIPSFQLEKPDHALEVQNALPLSPVFTSEVQTWASRIQIWAAGADLDPNLVATVMQIESCGDPHAQSRAGAIGLFQVMPYHFSPRDNAYDPATNALRGLDYLRRSLEAAHGDPRLAFAGYNGGIGVIERSESDWAAETRRYTYWGSGIYADAFNGKSESPRLQEWLAAGGTSLCLQAASQLGINP